MTMAHLHDTGYKFLFSHADLVRELLEVFAPPGVAELLNYATLRPETGNFITPAMKKREQDVVWSVELHGQRIYLYLLLEFQSSIDRGMPVRMMQYVSALYDHLLRSRRIDLSDGLPPVLPIVIYNGDVRWNHSAEIFDLIQPHPAVLTGFQPRLKFWLLDEGQFSAEYLEGLQRVMAAIFRMEHVHDTEDVKRAIRNLGKAVSQSPFRQTIEKAVTQWMYFRLNQKMPDLSRPEVNEIMKGAEMLETNLERIIANEKAKAKAEGVMLGELKGKLEGELKGELKGKLKGEAMLLERQMVKRFGNLAEDTRSRIKTASTDQLENWAERILDAHSLSEVFGDH